MTSAPTDPMIDRLIDGRYEVTSRIARGGMATVYVANDVRLDRRVAIKIMHGHLADDDAFRERFVQEARSAARLAHPNVVSVFDQGQDSEMAYMVMEYLPGMTLRDLLKDYGRLTTEQTLDIMEAVLGGLAAAHKAGIVHRDVKPENVLLADDGRIKIGDFGLARAASANTATGQALLGTIAYLSPELLTRGVADARSDIYASGIMMYEMLVGEQPYQGERPMQIAFQHANDTVPAPSVKNPTVSPEVDELVVWATARNPADRPHDAREMLDRLLDAEAVATAAIRATAAMLRASALETVAIDGVDPQTRVLPPHLLEQGTPADPPSSFGAGTGETMRFARPQKVSRPPKISRREKRAAAAFAAAGGGAAGAAAAVVAADAAAGVAAPSTAAASLVSGASHLGGTVASGATATTERFSPAVHGSVAGFGPGAGGAGAGAAGSRDDEGVTTAVETIRRPGRAAEHPVAKLEAKARRRHRRGWWVFALVIVLIAAGGGTGWYFSVGPGGQVGIPTVTDQTPDQAASTLSALGLQATQTTATSPTVPAGTLIGTDPPGGSSVLNGSAISVIVSAGPAQLPVPTLVGQAEAAARQAATDAQFTLTDSQTQFSSEAAAGTVLQALGADGQPLATTYGEQQPITFVVSLGAVPNVVGKSSADANAALVAVGLVSASGASNYSETVQEGDVISYALPADPVKPGATVTLEISKGPAPVDVPDVTGKSWSAAKAALQADGFTLAYNVLADLAPDAFQVRATDPAAGTSLPRGTKITVSFAGF